MRAIRRYRRRPQADRTFRSNSFSTRTDLLRKAGRLGTYQHSPSPPVKIPTSLRLSLFYCRSILKLLNCIANALFLLPLNLLLVWVEFYMEHKQRTWISCVSTFRELKRVVITVKGAVLNKYSRSRRRRAGYARGELIAG